MLVHLWFVTLAAFGVQRGLCLKCYSCLSNETRDACERLDKSRIPLQSCNLVALERTEKFAKEIDHTMGKFYEVHATSETQFPLNCLKQLVQKGGKHYTLRGCQLATTGDNLDICVKVKTENADYLKTTYCSLCSGDGCNTGSLQGPFLPLFGTLAAFLIFRQI